jgi:hypothetical protein
MEWLIALLCLCTIFVPPLIGVGIALIAQRYIGRWAYALGWLLPTLVIITAYAAYDAALRVIPCTAPEDSLACGNPVANAFLLFVGMLCVIALANACAQGAVYLFRNGQRLKQMPPQEPFTQEPFQQEQFAPEEPIAETLPQTDEDVVNNA